MTRLLISVRFHEGRYHGRPEWPPSPARLFQALVAGAAEGERLTQEIRCALAWLESLKPPIIVAPPMRHGQSFKNYVPNNDLDAFAGDLSRVGGIRTPKIIHPILFDPEDPLLYVWKLDNSSEAESNAQRILVVAERLYQLGRGIDMAWARGEILTVEEAEARIERACGRVYRPADRAGHLTLPVPTRGSLESLIERYRKMRERHQVVHGKPSRKVSDRKVITGQVFAQPPKPRFALAAYDSPAVRLVFDLVGETKSWRLDRVVELTERLRDAAARRLKGVWPNQASMVHNVIIGRRNSDDADKAMRVRISPLPSIGHRYADHAIRRVLVEMPPNCPLRAEDLEWAFSGPVASEEGEILLELAVAGERGMLAHYGVEAAAARLWRTVTPAALPQREIPRCIDRRREHFEAKGGNARAEEEGRVAAAVVSALRHAGITQKPLTVRVQREPFEPKGARAEAFASGTRFGKQRLWHVEVNFQEAVAGPLVIGDGRYLGLGLMAPKRTTSSVFAFDLGSSARITLADRAALLGAVRRALMALSRQRDRSVPLLFSGHEVDGAPARSGQHRHIFLAGADLDGDRKIERLIVAAPWACDRSAHPTDEEINLFEKVVASLSTVRAGRLGVIPLRFSSTDPRLIGPAQVWESHTYYRPARHAGRSKDATSSLARDVVAECDRRGLPKPVVELLDLSVGPRGGIAARLRLLFSIPVAGPILLGLDSHQGGGLFEAKRRE